MEAMREALAGSHRGRRLLGSASLALLALALAACCSPRPPVKKLPRIYEPKLPPAEIGDRSQLALDFGDFLVETSEIAPPGKRRKVREQAKDQYREACQSGKRGIRLRACNNLGALLLEDEENQEALKVLGPIREEMASEPLGLLEYLFNWGRALGKTGHLAEALDAFLEAVSLDGGFEPAVEAAFRIIQDLPAERKGENIGRLSTSLVQQGHKEEADRYLRETLEEAIQGEGEVPEGFVPGVARYLALAQVEPTEFHAAWRPLLERMQRKLTESGRLRIEALVRLYGDTGDNLSLPRTRKPVPVHELADPWQLTSEDRRLFSELSRALGSVQVMEGDAEKGAGFQELAWQVDPSNLEAAIDLAASIQNEDRLDPAGKVLTDLAQEAPTASEVPREQTESALRLHALLGGIFFERSILGSATEPGTAIFHWEKAAQIAMVAPRAEPVPILFENLGSIYERSGNPAKAFPLYLEAIYDYLRLDYPELAACLLRRADALAKDQRVAISENQREVIEKYRSRLADLPPDSCPEMGGSGPGIPVQTGLIRTVRFKFASSVLDSNAKAFLREFVAEHWTLTGGAKIRIEGHTDSKGTSQYNKVLGQQRAEAVQSFLRELGVPGDRISVDSYGEDNPEVNREDEEAYEANRRSVLRVIGPEGEVEPVPQG